MKNQHNERSEYEGLILATPTKDQRA